LGILFEQGKPATSATVETHSQTLFLGQPVCLSMKYNLIVYAIMPSHTSENV